MATKPSGLLRLDIDWSSIAAIPNQFVVWLQQYSAAVSVLFAAAVAIFTWKLAALTKRLWLVTKQSADAATRSANAAVRIELPILRVSTPELYSRPSNASSEDYLDGAEMVGLLPVSDEDSIACVPSIKFKNAGRTPALPIEIAAGHCVASALEGDPVYTQYRYVSASKIIAERGHARIDLGYDMTFSPQTIVELAEKKAQLWFFCQLRYTDFMEEQHNFRWCWVWDCPTKAGPYYFSSWKTVPRSFRGTC